VRDLLPGPGRCINSIASDGSRRNMANAFATPK
jgi:hypothetical protein